jgi:hypothetical protein
MHDLQQLAQLDAYDLAWLGVLGHSHSYEVAWPLDGYDLTDFHLGASRRSFSSSTGESAALCCDPRRTLAR